MPAPPAPSRSHPSVPGTAMLTAHALIFATLLDGQGGARELGADAAAVWRPEDGMLWMHLNLRDPAAGPWLQEASGLHPQALDALMAEETRPRLIHVPDGIVLLLRGVNLNPGEEVEDMVSLRLWSDGRRVITMRLRPLRAVEDVRTALGRSEGPADAGALVARLALRLAERMEDVVLALRDAMDDVEESEPEEHGASMRDRLADLRRQAALLRRYASPQRAALHQLRAEAPGWFTAEARATLGEALDDVTRYVEDLETVRERGAIVHERLAAHHSHQVERRMYALSLIAALFLPLTFVTGLLGVNLAGIPGADSPWAFAGLCAVLVTLVATQVWIMRRHGLL